VQISATFSVGFTKLNTQEIHAFLCSQILISQADQYVSHKNVTKAMRDFNFRWAVSISGFAQWKQAAEC